MSSLTRLFAILAGLAALAAAAAPPYSISVISYGAVGDGVTDNTLAFTNALNVAANFGGSIVQVPPGNYLINGQLTIPSAVTLQGTFRGPPRSYNFGSVLLTTYGHNNASAGPFILMQADSAIDGLIIHYPEQNGWPQPFPYGPTIRQGGDSPTIRNIFVTNPWWMLDLGTITGGRHVVEGVWGQPLYLGLFVDNCFDVGRITNVHFWPFWNSSQAFWTGWTAQQATAFLLGRSDWQMMDQVFSFAYKVGWHFVGGSTGQGGNYMITSSGSDEPGTPIVIESVWPMQGLLFTNCQFMGATSRIMSTNQAPIKFTSCAFVGNPNPNLGYNGTDTILQISGGSLKMDQSDIYMWSQSHQNAPAISVGPNARAVVTNTEFRNGNSNVPIQFAPGSRGIFSNNMCSGGCQVGVPKNSSNIFVSENVAF